jgi:hypothetical protein
MISYAKLAINHIECFEKVVVDMFRNRSISLEVSEC